MQNFPCKIGGCRISSNDIEDIDKYQKCESGKDNSKYNPQGVSSIIFNNGWHGPFHFVISQKLVESFFYLYL